MVGLLPNQLVIKRLLFERLRVERLQVFFEVALLFVDVPPETQARLVALPAVA